MIAAAGKIRGFFASLRMTTFLTGTGCLESAVVLRTMSQTPESMYGAPGVDGALRIGHPTWIYSE